MDGAGRACVYDTCDGGGPAGRDRVDMSGGEDAHDRHVIAWRDRDAIEGGDMARATDGANDDV
jgi:hypothetical protein